MRLLIGTILVVALAACGGSSSSSEGVIGIETIQGPETALDYCTDYWSALASRYAGCVAGARELILAHDDPAVLCPEVAKAVAAGRAKYDKARGGACLGYVQSADCYGVEALFDNVSDQADCAGTIAGQVGAMGQCYRDHDCQDGWCSTSEQCPGVCIPLAGEGGACDALISCKPGFTCSGGVCVPLFSQGTKCSTSPQCQPNLFCAPHGTSPQTCDPRIPVGGTCANTAQCVIGADCNGPQGAMTCKKRLGPGEACGVSLQECGPGLYCSSASSTCVVDPGPSQSCLPAASSGYEDCLVGTCNADGFICELPSLWDGCVSDWDCGSSLACGVGGCSPACTEP